MFLFPDKVWGQYLLGALEPMVYDYNWFESGDMQTWEASEAFRLIIEQAPYNLLPSEVPAPYWDSDEDVDDDAPADDQSWYGYVEDPEAPIGELTFFESAVIWGFTGFVAFATLEVGAAPAVAFHTLAERWVLAWKRNDVGEAFRVIVDGAEVGRVDTESYAEGDIVEMAVVGDPELTTHDILIVQVG